jgi:hypothetical protein
MNSNQDQLKNVLLIFQYQLMELKLVYGKRRK